MRDVSYTLMALGQLAGCRGKRYNAQEIMAEAVAEIIRLTAENDQLRQERDELKRWHELVCQACHGIGEITVTSGQTPESFSQENIPCPSCVGQILDERDAAFAKGRADMAEEAAKHVDDAFSIDESEDAMLSRIAQELRALSAAVPTNQCDGCNSGMPIEDGIHQHNGHPHMCCTKGKYSAVVPVEVEL